MPFTAVGGSTLGWTYQTDAGYGWITVYGTHPRHTEASRAHAEQLLALALVQDRSDGRSGAEEARVLLVDCGHLTIGSAREAVAQRHKGCLVETTHDEDGTLLGWTFAVPNSRDGNRIIRYGWITETGQIGQQLMNDRNKARFELARDWATDQLATE